MMPPMSRVLAPQLLCCGCTRSPSSFKNWVPKALAKLSPRSWLVPACTVSLGLSNLHGILMKIDRAVRKTHPLAFEHSFYLAWECVGALYSADLHPA